MASLRPDQTVILLVLPLKGTVLKPTLSWVQWFRPAILELGRLKREYGCKFEASQVRFCSERDSYAK